MKVQAINNNYQQNKGRYSGVGISFGKLYNGYLVKENIIKANDSLLKKELNSISRLIRKEKLHKKENVDIVLQYTKENGFYGVISSKTHGTPNCFGYKQNISKDKTGLDKFVKWVNSWNYMYSL